MKKICIALDYSLSAEKVAEIGYSYAKALGAKTALVHVVTDMVYYGVEFSPIMGYTGAPVSTRFEMAEDFRKEAEKFLAASVRHLEDETLETAVLHGEIADAILDYAKRWNADLLVIGTHSHSGLEEVLMGNTGVKVVKHSPIPLLVIPTNDATAS